MTHMSDPSDYCPGCNARLCACPPHWHEDDLDDDAYQAGRAACLAVGYDERPTPAPSRWSHPHAEAWLEGFDDAGCGLASRVEDPSAHREGVRALITGQPLPEASGYLYGPWRPSYAPL